MEGVSPGRVDHEGTMPMGPPCRDAEGASKGGVWWNLQGLLLESAT